MEVNETVDESTAVAKVDIQQDFSSTNGRTSRSRKAVTAPKTRKGASNNTKAKKDSVKATESSEIEKEEENITEPIMPIVDVAIDTNPSNFATAFCSTEVLISPATTAKKSSPLPSNPIPVMAAPSQSKPLPTDIGLTHNSTINRWVSDVSRVIKSSQVCNQAISSYTSSILPFFFISRQSSPLK